MSDRVILMRKGRIEQSGTPETLFEPAGQPLRREFMGFENVLPAVVETVADDRVVARVGRLRDRRPVDGACRRRAGCCGPVAIRAERLAPASRTRPGARRTACRRRRASAPTAAKYVDQTADTPVGPLKVRIWDRTVHTTIRRRGLERRRLRRAAGLVAGERSSFQDEGGIDEQIQRNVFAARLVRRRFS